MNRLKPDTLNRVAKIVGGGVVVIGGGVVGGIHYLNKGFTQLHNDFHNIDKRLYMVENNDKKHIEPKLNELDKNIKNMNEKINKLDKNVSIEMNNISNKLDKVLENQKRWFF